MSLTPNRRTSGTPSAVPSASSAPSGPSSSNGGAPENGNDLDSIFNLGASGVQEDIKAAPARVRRTVVKAVEDAEQSVTKAGKIDPAKIREKILSADFDSVQQLADAEEKDFAKALEDLEAVSNEMGVDFQKLIQPSEEEMSLVANAKAVVASLETQRKGKEKSWNVLGSRDRALAQIDQQLTEARQNIITAETKVKQMMRTRLMSAKMDASINAYVDVSNKTVEIMKARVIDVGTHVTMLQERQNDAQKQKSEASTALKKLIDELKGKEAELKILEDDLTALTNGTPEYTAKEKEILQLRNKIEEVRGNRDVALAKFESKEKFLQQLSVSLTTLMNLRDTHKARIVRLMSDTQERGATYKARLMAMKTMADQQFDAILNSIGETLDQQTLEYMASVTVAATDALMKQFEAHPEKLREQGVVLNTLAENMAKLRKRGSNVLKEGGDRYGSDPAASSFSSYSGDEPTAPGAPAAPEDKQ